jgi:hypothetical protein
LAITASAVGTGGGDTGGSFDDVLAPEGAGRVKKIFTMNRSTRKMSTAKPSIFHQGFRPKYQFSTVVYSFSML